MTTDMQLSAQIESQGSYEKELAKVQAETIARNIARWQQEQQQKAAKRQADYAAAAKKGMTLAGLKELRREEWRKRNCRATIQQIVEHHTQQQKESK